MKRILFVTSDGELVRNLFAMVGKCYNINRVLPDLAIKNIRNWEPDLVIIDRKVLDEGVEILPELICASIPVLILFVDETNMVRLTKDKPPMTTEELMKEINSLIG